MNSRSPDVDCSGIRRGARIWRSAEIRPCLILLMIWSLTTTAAVAQTPHPRPLATHPFSQDEFEAMEQRLWQLEQSQSQLLHQNREMSRRLQMPAISSRSQDSASFERDTTGLPPLPTADSDTSPPPSASTFQTKGSTPEAIFQAPLSDSAAEFPLERIRTEVGSSRQPPEYYTGFDRGFVIRPKNQDESPFELKINTQSQFRYTGFERDVTTWTDSSGEPNPVSDVSNFQIPRGRMIFSGHAFRPDLTYNLNLDFNTVSNRQLNFRAYWLAWRFSRARTLYAGQSKVPGSREWLISFVDTLGVDRSMATTFFRPSLSQGIWATGEPADGFFYHVMLANGFNTLGASTQQLNTQMAYSGSCWWEPLGDFGSSYGDFQWHQQPVLRVGMSGTYSSEEGPQGSPNVPENSDIRFSDGTLLTKTGALGPGATINVYKIGLLSWDVAYKHRGFSLSSEVYLQDLFNLSGDLPLSRSSVCQYGGLAQAGYFVIPQKFEPYTRFSRVNGPLGTGSEYAGGFNWFFLPGKQNLRFTMDAAWLDHCAADQNRTGYQAGQTGILVRSQIQIFF